jgi:hypothetical protein
LGFAEREPSLSGTEGRGNAMTKKIASNEHQLSASPNAALLMMVGAALSWFCVSTSAQERASSPASIEVVASGRTPADLEKAFWICDHAATNHGVDGGAAIACGAITESLKVSKFNGDFDSMLAWWRENKVAQHRALGMASRETSGR